MLMGCQQLGPLHVCTPRSSIVIRKTSHIWIYQPFSPNEQGFRMAHTWFLSGQDNHIMQPYQELRHDAVVEINLGDDRWIWKGPTWEIRHPYNTSET